MSDRHPFFVPMVLAKRRQPATMFWLTRAAAAKLLENVAGNRGGTVTCDVPFIQATIAVAIKTVP